MSEEHVNCEMDIPLCPFANKHIRTVNPTNGLRSLIIPKTQEKPDIPLIRFQIPNIQNPHPIRLPVKRQLHLFPNLWNLVIFDPFVVSRIADEVQMVVNSCSTCTVLFGKKGESTDVPLVVVCPKENYVVWDGHTVFIEALNFFICEKSVC